MTEEEKPEQDNVEKTPEEASEAELPERFRDKSAAEIAKSYEELEKQSGEQGREFGETKKTMEDMKSELAWHRQQPSAPQPQPQVETPEKRNERFFEDPMKTMDEYFGKKLQDYDRYQKQEYVRRESPRVMAELERTAPEIFGDPEVAKGTMAFVNHAISQGGDPMMLADSNALLAVGLNVKYFKDKKSPEKHPVTPTTTEAPAAVKSQEPAEEKLTLGTKDVGMVNYWARHAPEAGVKTEKDVAELMKEELKEGENR